MVKFDHGPFDFREQVGGSVVRHKSFVNQRSSTWYRPEAEMSLIAQKGDKE